MTAPLPAALVPHSTITEMVGYRDAALTAMREAARLLHEGEQKAVEAQALAQSAYGMSAFHLRDYSKNDDYKKLFHTIDPEVSLEAYRKQLDARLWVHALDLTGMRDLMDRTAREQLDADLCAHVPEFTEDSAYQVLESLLGDAKLIFQRGLARAFIELDRRFKSHDGFKIGARVILTRVFDPWGCFNYHGRMRDTLADVERAFAILDRKVPTPGSLAQAIQDSRKGRRMEPCQSYIETPYFRVRCFQNGNAHLWFRRDDLVEKANDLLADYYGEVLPDSPTEAEMQGRDLKSKAGLPAVNLSFYPTPSKVVDLCLRDVHIEPGMKVLEPSAGTGNMVRSLLGKGLRIDAYEIDAARAAILRGLPRNEVFVHEGNFLAVPASPSYNIVLMNPPFFGTHWVEHVTHAFEFLAPGGTLVAVLPVSAELGESSKHEAFRTWAKARQRRWSGQMFHDLPPESFAESGTRINTVMLVLHRGR